MTALAQTKEPTLLVPNAVLDTNVGVTIYSWHDLIDAGDSLLRKNPNATLEDPALSYRRRRARSAFLLMLFLNEKKWTVRIALNEHARVLVSKVPPDSEKGNFTRLFLYFLNDLLPDWLPAGDPADDANKKGTEVDLLCLDWAEQDRVPLISWEGDTPTGPDLTKVIPQEAAARGIDLVTPEQLLERHKFVEGPATKRFFSEWDAHAAAYLKGTPKARDTMILMRHFFERLADNYWGP